MAKVMVCPKCNSEDIWFKCPGEELMCEDSSPDDPGDCETCQYWVFNCDCCGFRGRGSEFLPQPECLTVISCMREWCEAHPPCGLECGLLKEVEYVGA